MVNEIAAKEVLCLAFRAVRLGENELERVIIRYVTVKNRMANMSGRNILAKEV